MVAQACNPRVRDRRIHGALSSVSQAHPARPRSMRGPVLKKQGGTRLKMIPVIVLYTPACLPAPTQMCTYRHTYRSHRHTPEPMQTCTQTRTLTGLTDTHTKLSITTFSGLELWLSGPKAFPVLFRGPDFSSQHPGGEGCNCPAPGILVTLPGLLGTPTPMHKYKHS